MRQMKFVGGPWHGETKPVLVINPSIHVPVMEDTQLDVVIPNYLYREAPKYHYVTYVLRQVVLRPGERPIELYVEQRIRMEGLLSYLTERMEQEDGSRDESGGVQEAPGSEHVGQVPEADRHASEAVPPS